MADDATFNLQVETIRRKLSTVAPAPREALANKNNAAAVLIPIFERSGELHIIYIRRSDHVASHRGQVAFPGGRVDPVDATLLDAALREAHEEVGIPPSTVDVIGAFATMQTTPAGSSSRHSSVSSRPTRPSSRNSPRSRKSSTCR